jgi:hypothetical protein
MRSEAELVPPIYVVWRQAAQIRQGWSVQTRANRRRKARALLRRIGLDESLLPPVAPHYEPGDRRYRPAESVPDENPLADDNLPPANPGLLQRRSPPRVRARGTKQRGIRRPAAKNRRTKT